MTDFADSCFGCGGHRRKNIWHSHLCPECEAKHERGEMTAFGDPVAATVERELRFTMELQKARAA